MSGFLNRKNLFNEAVCLLVLFCFVACNAGFTPSFKQSITDSTLRSRMSRVIDAQIETVRDYLDDDLKACIDGASRGTDGMGGTRATGKRMSGSDIVDVTLRETGGRDYLDFCYAVDTATATGDIDAVMDTARCILPADKYLELVDLSQDLERQITLKGDEMARAIPLDQQAAFYKDLKTLVVRAIVLLTAGIVYACMPTVIFWGKISAACAISVGAGLVAITIMSLYEYYRFGTGEGMTFEDWFKILIKIPQADFALTTAVTTVAEAMGCGPVVTGIIICVFALYNIVDMVRSMLRTYNFDA